MHKRPVAKLDKLVQGAEGEANGSRELFCHLRKQIIDEQVLQVVFQKASQSASLRESKAEVNVLPATRLKGRGFESPMVLYTDMCCGDVLMVEIFRELRDQGHDLSVGDDGPASSEGLVFELPSDVLQIGYIHASKDTYFVRAGADMLR